MSFRQLTRAECQERQAALYRSLHTLKQKRPSWDAATATRGDATIANLIRQIDELDDLLLNEPERPRRVYGR